MDPITIAALVTSAISGLAKGGIGISQRMKAKKLEEQNVRPEMGVPESVSEATDVARGMTFMRDIPGADIYRNQIKGATSQGIGAVQEMGIGAEGFGAVAEMVGGQQSQFATMSAELPGMIEANKAAYMEALGREGAYEEKAWEWNEADPYNMAASKASQLREGGTTNIMSGVGDISGGIAYGIAGAQDNVATEDMDIEGLIETLKGLGISFNNE